MVETVELRTLGTVVKTTYEDNPDTNAYTDDEKTKLAGIAAQATKNGSDAQLLARTSHTGSQAIGTVTGLQTALDAKLDRVVGKELSDNNYTTAEKTKLAGMAAEATKNSADAVLLARANHTGTQAIATVAGLQTALDTKVDKVDGKELSDNNYTTAEKTKLAGLEGPHFKGTHTSLAALQSAGIVAVAGDYADVDGGSGQETFRCIWDVSNQEWVQQLGASTQLTGAQIKTQYEAQPDTNAFTDAEKAKLSDIAAEATKNSTDAVLLARANHTGTQAIATVTGLQTALDGKVNADGSKVLSDNNYTSDEKTKLASVAAEATKNSTDAVLLARTNHTGTQAIATVTGLQTALDGKVNTDGTKVLSDNNYTSTEKTKLSGIATEATKNSADAVLLARANHTGTQAIATVAGLQTAIDGKVNADGSKVLSDNNYATIEKNKLAGIITGIGNNFTWRNKGVWNASTNTPTLVNGTGTEGDYYTVSVPATRSFGAVAHRFLQNDIILYSAGIWQKISVNTPYLIPRGTISPPIPALYATLSGNTNTPNGATTAITNWQASYDQFSILNTSHNVVIPAWATHARFSFSFGAPAATGDFRIFSNLYRDGSIIMRSLTLARNLELVHGLLVSPIIPVTSGQRFDVAVNHNFGTAINLSIPYTYLQVELYESV